MPLDPWLQVPHVGSISIGLLARVGDEVGEDHAAMPRDLIASRSRQ